METKVSLNFKTRHEAVGGRAGGAVHTGVAYGFLVVGVNLHYKNLTITLLQKTKFLSR